MEATRAVTRGRGFGLSLGGNLRHMNTDDSDFRFSPRPNRAHEIAWRPWGEPAFSEARRLGRPILLSLSAVWRHWGLVMDETTYSDPAVIAAVNERYVPVRVDNDRRPDVNRRYNMGGWPTTAFLTPGGDIITGATYLPPPEMRQALTRVREYFEANSARLQHTAGPVLEEPGDGPHEADDAALARIPDQLVRAVLLSVDPAHGGIGSAPKFPQAEVFAFLLAYVSLRPDALDSPRAVSVAAKTLQAMARGGLRDHAGKGFYRYSTQRDWSEPHYEKMLEDEARLAALYLEAYGLAQAGLSGLDDPSLHRDAAASAIDHLLGELWLGDPPAFGGSQDADETYYGLGAEAREALPAPFVDPTVYVDWNALATRALLRASTRLARADLGVRALETLEFLWRGARDEGLMAHFVAPGGETWTGAKLFADQANVAAALLEAYEVTGERTWLSRAAELVDLVERFAGSDGRYGDRPAEPTGAEGLLARPVPTLEENSLMADVLLRLTSFTGDETYRDRGLHILGAWLPYYERYGVGAAPYGVALLRAVEHPAHVVVVARPGSQSARRLAAAALTAPHPLRTVQMLDPDDDADARHIAAAGHRAQALPAAFVCRGRSCLPPTGDPVALSRSLLPRA